MKSLIHEDIVKKISPQDELCYNNIKNLFKPLGLKRKLRIFCSFESFFKLHSRATEGKKDKIRVKKNNFLANSKSLNYFIQRDFAFNSLS